MTKEKKNILIRCDSSREIGTGHSKRSFNLAKDLKDENTNIIFFCRNEEGNIGCKLGEFKDGEITFY